MGEYRMAGHARNSFEKKKTRGAKSIILKKVLRRNEKKRNWSKWREETVG